MIFGTLEHILTHISFSIISIVIPIYMMTLFYEITGLSDSSEKGMIATFIFLTGFLVIRWIDSRHFPLSNLYESLLFLSWNFALIHIVARIRNCNKNFSAITGTSSIFTQGFVTSGLLTEMHQSGILVPALQSWWLMMHVSMMLLSYAALLCGSLLSITILVITFTRRIKNIGKINPLLVKSLHFGPMEDLKKNRSDFESTSIFSFRNYHRYQLIRQLDDWSYRVIGIGFTLLTIGILSGAIWANETWGSYWNWDPKETWAFITWTVYAIYSHTRTNTSLKGANSAIAASMGFFFIWICYFGVNLLGIGLHSYGSFALSS
uniref:Cytochrome c biogenesis protein CcsA n=1 Tax=Trithuria lanterna TaxID=764935 RepID=A0A858FKW0_9MAGN|nr:cytochrome c heme attachment protein [Trithuria lanterna]QII42287.1 cytochrome c heme attachment protein [Trithuria lanterna]